MSRNPNPTTVTATRRLLGQVADAVVGLVFREEVKSTARESKEGIRGIVQSFLLKRTSRLMAKWIVEVATRNLNDFPSKNGMSDTLSQLSIATRSPPPDTRSHPLDFGACAEALEENGWFQTSNK